MQLKRMAFAIKDRVHGSKLIKNIILSFFGEGGAAALAFVNTALLIIVIGNYDYGVLTIAYEFILIIDSVINFQSWQAVIKFGSEYLEDDNVNGFEALVKTCALLDIVTAIVGGLFAILTANMITKLMNWDYQTCALIYVLAIQIFFNFTGTSMGVIRLLDKYKYFTIYRIVSEFLRCVAVVLLCVVCKFGIFGAAIAYTISYVIGYIILFLLFLKVIKEDNRLSVKRILSAKTHDYRRKIFGFTLWTNLTASADIPVQQFDIMLLSLLSPEIVAVFKVYKQIGAILNKLVVPIKQAVMPTFSELVAKDEKERAYDLFLDIKNKCNKVLVPAVIFVSLICIPAMSLILGEIYSKYWYILISYLLLRAFALSYATIHMLFISLGKVRLDFIYTIIANILYLIVTIMTIRSIGIWAIILGIAIQYLISIGLKVRKSRMLCYMKDDA